MHEQLGKEIGLACCRARQGKASTATSAVSSCKQASGSGCYLTPRARGTARCALDPDLCAHALCPAHFTSMLCSYKPAHRNKLEALMVSLCQLFFYKASMYHVNARVVSL